MATFQDLEREVAKLRKQVHKLQGNPDANQQAVSELTGSGEDNHERQAGRTTGHGFSALAAKVREKSRENVLRDAEAFARSNLQGNWNVTALKEVLFHQFGISGHDLDEVISRAKEH